METRIVVEVDVSEDGTGLYEEVTLPTVLEVCGRCRGEGSHCNPNIDGNGITSSEWAEWDDESREMYMSGGYDVTCEECGGLRVVPTIDEKACERDPLLKRAMEQHWSNAQADADDRRYQRMESGERF
jgi:hypothetical protein